MKSNAILFVSVLFLFMWEISFAQPKMNEIYSRGVPGNLDWIEIYNGAASSIDISGYKIYDSGGQSGSKPKKLFPTGATIPANGFYVIITDTADFPGDLSGFGLSQNGESVWLEDASGLVIDNVAFPSMSASEQSYGRLPDGGTWQLLNTITRGFSNVPVGVLNETTLIKKYALYQNYPNPFNPSTSISWQSPVSSWQTLKVYDMLGNEVATLVNEYKPAGKYELEFQSSGTSLQLASGIYFYQLQVGDFVSVKKMLLAK